MKHFQRNGFAILPRVIGGNQLTKLIEAIESASLNDSSIKRRGEQYALRNLPALIPAVKALADSRLIQELMKNVLGAEPLLVRGLLFDKTPSANWNVGWHQDLLITVHERRDVTGYGPWSVKAGVPHVQPPVSVLENMATLRLHLDDCGEDNGPLRVLSGSHRAGILATEQIDALRQSDDPVTCIVPRGGVLVMRPLLLHASSAAKQPGHRRVVHLEFASGQLDGDLQWHAAD